MDQTRNSGEGNSDGAERSLFRMLEAQQDAPPSEQVNANLILQERKSSVLSTISEKEFEGDHSSCERESLEKQGEPTNKSVIETKLSGTANGDFITNENAEDHKVSAMERNEEEQSSSEEDSFENQGEPRNHFTLRGMTGTEFIEEASNAMPLFDREAILAGYLQELIDDLNSDDDPDNEEDEEIRNLVSYCIEMYDAMHGIRRDSSARETETNATDGQTPRAEDDVGTGDADNLTVRDKTATGSVFESDGNGGQGPASEKSEQSCEQPEQSCEQPEQCCENPEEYFENPEECCELCNGVQLPEVEEAGGEEAEE